MNIVDFVTRRGWSIIPVRSNKRPAITDWQKYQYVTPNPARVQEWGRIADVTGYAVITGAISRLVILDFDGSIGSESMERLKLSPHVRTGSGGFHCYFQHPGPLVPRHGRERTKDYPGLDILGEERYAVFSGRSVAGEYEHLRPLDPDPLDVLPRDLRLLLGVQP